MGSSFSMYKTLFAETSTNLKPLNFLVFALQRIFALQFRFFRQIIFLVLVQLLLTNLREEKKNEREGRALDTSKAWWRRKRRKGDMEGREGVEEGCEEEGRRKGRRKGGGRARREEGRARREMGEKEGERKKGRGRRRMEGR